MASSIFVRVVYARRRARSDAPYLALLVAFTAFRCERALRESESGDSRRTPYKKLVGFGVVGRFGSGRGDLDEALAVEVGEQMGDVGFELGGIDFVFFEEDAANFADGFEFEDQAPDARANGVETEVNAGFGVENGEFASEVSIYLTRGRLEKQRTQGGEGAKVRVHERQPRANILSNMLLISNLHMGGVVKDFTSLFQGFP